MLRLMIIVWSLLPAVLCSSIARGEPPAAALESRIVALGLFKNGLAVVKREVRLPGPGVFEIADVPEPVHGTFWIESTAKVTARVTSREVDAPQFAAPGGNLQRELAGQRVTIRLRDPQLPAITGTVEKFDEPPQPLTWSRDYQPGGQARFLSVIADAGRTLVDTSMIATLSVEGEPSRPRMRLPVLEFSVQADAGDRAPAGGEPHVLQITYLAKGISWAPAYKVDLGEGSTLALRQQAVVRNELEDFADAEITLISGFPSMEFSNVVSPLAPTTSLAAFFNQLAQQPLLRSPSRREIIQQQAVMSNIARSDPDADFTAIPTGDGVDLHYQAIGRRSLRAGESLLLEVAEGRADYQRIVEWITPDLRDEFGNPGEWWRRQHTPEELTDEPYDAVRFRNPLPFAMTTAPAMIVSGERFNGQQTSRWVNAGEQTTLPITRALSMRARRFEQEEAGEREVIDYGGATFRKTAVRGEVDVSNHRNEEVTMVIRGRFSGELLEADGQPRDTLREEGVWSVNRRHELIWTITLKPGEARTLKYRYSVLVRH